jgi:hypothetical protein
MWVLSERTPQRQRKDSKCGIIYCLFYQIYFFDMVFDSAVASTNQIHLFTAKKWRHCKAFITLMEPRRPIQPSRWLRYLKDYILGGQTHSVGQGQWSWLMREPEWDNRVVRFLSTTACFQLAPRTADSPVTVAAGDNLTTECKRLAHPDAAATFRPH